MQESTTCGLSVGKVCNIVTRPSFSTKIIGTEVTKVRQINVQSDSNSDLIVAGEISSALSNQMVIVQQGHCNCYKVQLTCRLCVVIMCSRETGQRLLSLRCSSNLTGSVSFPMNMLTIM